MLGDFQLGENRLHNSIILGQPSPQPIHAKGVVSAFTLGGILSGFAFLAGEGDRI